MSKEQIEELAKFLWHNTNMYDEGLIYDVAVSMHNAGYRKQIEGEWGNYEPYLDGYRCSSCKLTHRTCTVYCPNCGAKMKGSAE